MNHKSLAALFFALATVPATASARVTITLNSSGQQIADALSIDLVELSSQLDAEISTAFNELRPTEYLQSLSDAQAFSTKGLGVDYASNPELFVLGAAGSVALAAGDKGFAEKDADQPVSGIAPNVTIMAGLNLDMIGLGWLTIYGNFFARKVPYDQLTATVRNIGLHAQVKLFRPEGDPMELLFQWGGLDITTGFMHSYLKLSLEDSLQTQLPLGGEQASTDATFDSLGIVSITNKAFIIPLELTTNFRFLYILSVYGGVGIDIQAGSSDLDIKIDGTLTAKDPRNGDDVDIGTAEVEVSAQGKPSTGKIRFLAGLQVNVWFVRVFAQANLNPDKAVSMAFGGRLAW